MIFKSPGPAPKVLRILYADAALLVVDKPPGLLSVTGRTACGTLQNASTMLTRWALDNQKEIARAWQRTSAFTVVEQLKKTELLPLVDTFESMPRDIVGSRMRHLRQGLARWTTKHREAVPLGVHRLDLATSGLLVFALSYPAQRALMLHFRGSSEIAKATEEHGLSISGEYSCSKVYEAVVDSRAAEVSASPGCSAGVVSALLRDDEGIVDTPLQRHGHLPLLQTHSDPSEAHGSSFSSEARTCVTRWRVLERGRGAIRLQLEPLTGRTHQLRLHCALPPPFGLGCPIIGDSFYGDPALSEFPYLLELMQRAREFKDSSRSDGSAAVDGSASFATSVDLLAQAHAHRSNLLARAGREGEMPALDSCPLLPQHSSASPEPARQVPRLLLHARELHLPDAFSHADRAIGRQAWLSENQPRQADDCQPRYRKERGSDKPSSPRVPLPPKQPENRARDYAIEAGAGLWERIAPWHVADESHDALQNGTVSVRELPAVSDTGSNRSTSLGANAASVGCRRIVAFRTPTPF